MSEKICIFAGTTEGRKLADILKDAADVTACVATEYGEVMLESVEGITVHTGRMDEAVMEQFFREQQFSRVIDATHPYADVVTENICSAASAAGVPVIRVLREEEKHIDDAVYVSSAREAAEYLAGREGNIFITTGSKEISEYRELDMSRVWARVLPSAASLQACLDAGIASSHIIAAQGPFTAEINSAQMRMIGADYMVTKASGRSGGFDEKIAAAAETGAVPVIIGQPKQNEGMTLDEAVSLLGKEMPLGRRNVCVIGIGPGGHEFLTSQARTALEECDAVIGASSVTDAVGPVKPVYREYMPAGIRSVLDENPSIRKAAVVMRGDTGFFSGARNLVETLDGYEVTVFPGISSVSLLSARLGVSWDDAKMASMHGRDCNIVSAVRRNRKVFVLCGGSNTPDAICGRLAGFGFGDLDAAVGEKLSYADERIIRGKVRELAETKADPLSVLYIENPSADSSVRTGISDDEFIRTEVPMTKSEIRAVSLSKLQLSSDSVIWDVGAGTGSVSVECALSAYDGTVYAIEKNGEAADLIERNSRQFRTDNIKVIRGTAPEALSELPAPTHVFVGGSSGGMDGIIAEALEKNPDVRIVINTVTLESMTDVLKCAEKFGFGIFETVAVAASRSRKVGRYNMMNSQNQVFVFTLQKGRADE